MRLSVLDQSPVVEGSTAGDALRNTISLAQATDRLGYHRFWVSEHHNAQGLAGSSPEVLIGPIAEATERIRVGSGGVMLTHYSPYKVAENFRVLEALYPGRIDLGVGRAPGSDQRTMFALAPSGKPLGIEYYPSQLEELRTWLVDGEPANQALRGVQARPLGDQGPELWVLASSVDSASIAAHFGLPLGWAYFIAGGGEEICQAYRREFTPTATQAEPHVSVGVAAICAETADEAEHLATSIRAWRTQGLLGSIPKPGDPASAEVNPLAVSVTRPAKPLIVGTPETVRSELLALGEACGADELMVVTIVHDHRARVRSYELLADAFELSPSG